MGGARRRHETAFQTAGPYVHIGLLPDAVGIDALRPLGTEIAGRDVEGPRISVEGRVIDGAGEPLRDAVIEVWQADADGRYPGDGAAADFRGWGRAMTDFETGIWRIETVRPGQVAAPDGGRMAPHLALWIIARGINVGLSTRLYFADAAEANAADPVLALVPPERRATLLAQPVDPGHYRFDILLQGPQETVFLDV